MPCHLGLLLVAHHYDAESAGHLRTLAHAAGVQGRLATVGRRSGDEIGQCLRALHAAAHDAVAVVPLFVTSDSRLVRRAAEMVTTAAGPGGIRVTVTGALDASAEAMDVLADRARRLAETRSRQALLLVGHGPVADEDLPQWEALGAALAAGVRDRTGFAAVEVDLVRDDATPEVRAAAVSALRDRVTRLSRETGHPVVVVPWILGAGRLTRERLPADLAGLEVRFDGQPMLPHPALARWVARQLAAARITIEGAGA